MNVIRKRIPVCELLAGLAEESAELAQAALKLRRVYDGTNYTPVSEERATEQLYEEIADVELYLKQIDINRSDVCRIMDEKEKRWEERLEIQNKAVV